MFFCPRIVVFILVLLLKKGEKRRQLQGSGGSLDLDMENLLEDSVMCRVRAKRGCATHPRSIAERVLKFPILLIFFCIICGTD